MKDGFLSLFWAAVCAGLATWYIVEQDAKYHFLSQWWIFPTLSDILKEYQIPMEVFIFSSLTLLFLITGLHKLIGNGIRILIGIAGFITLVCLVVLGALIVLSLLIKLF